MAEEEITVRAARNADRVLLAALFAAVADERDGIVWRLDGTLVAVAQDQVVGSLHVDVRRFGLSVVRAGVRQ